MPHCVLSPHLGRLQMRGRLEFEEKDSKASRTGARSEDLPRSGLDGLRLTSSAGLPGRPQPLPVQPYQGHRSSPVAIPSHLLSAFRWNEIPADGATRCARRSGLEGVECVAPHRMEKEVEGAQR